MNLVGSEEAVSATLRFFFASKYAADNDAPSGIKWYSESGIDATRDAAEGLTDNDLRKIRNESACIVIFRDGDDEVIEYSNDMIWGKRVTYCDILATHVTQNRRSLMEQIRNWIDETIFANSRTTSFRRASGNNNNTLSSVVGFGEPVEWERIMADGDHGVTEQISGEIETYFLRGR